MGEVSRRRADDAHRRGHRAAALAQRSDLVRGGRGDLPAADAAALASMSRRCRALHRASTNFLGVKDDKVPFIIGVAGSVAVGKSTTARILAALLRRWPSSPKVDLVTTDGFLHPNRVLEERGIMDRKGFPESYDRARVRRRSSPTSSRASRNVAVPVYSHLVYDVVPGEFGDHRPARHPHRRGAQHPAAGRAAQDRQADPLRLRLHRFLDLHRRRRGRPAPLVHGALPAPARRPPSPTRSRSSTASPR